MTREELLALVKVKVDFSKLTSLSQKTINEELDDVLEDLGDDTTANDGIITKLANRLKRMDGNLHKNVSDEIKKSREEAERKKKEEEEAHKGGENHKGEPDDKIAALEAKINKLLEDNEKRDKAAAKNAVVESVKEGLKAKFEKAGIPLNKFFVNTAMQRLEIPDDNADVKELVSKAEMLYNSDIKDAGWEPNAKPRGGSGGGGGSDKIDEHEFDDVAALRSRNKPKD